MTRLCADDTAAYRVVTCHQNQDQLQQDLQRLADWEKCWDMEFHPGKCTSLSVTRSRNPLKYYYEPHGHILTAVDEVKYLGITKQKDLSWDRHIGNICSKASKALALGFLRRNIKIISRLVKRRRTCLL